MKKQKVGYVEKKKLQKDKRVPRPEHPPAKVLLSVLRGESKVVTLSRCPK